MTGKENISRKDKLTISLSILALAISFTSLYLTQFYASYDAEAIVVELDLQGGKLDYQVALFNKGTHKLLVTEAAVLRKKSKNDNALLAENPLASIHLENKLPAILEPKDVLLLHFRGPLNLDQLYMIGEVPDSGGYEEYNGDLTRKLALEVHISGLDFSGEKVAVNIDVGSFHFTKNTVTSSSGPEKYSAHFIHR